MLAPEVLDLLRCPATGQRLRAATKCELDAAFAIKAEPLSGGLVTEGGALLYPIHSGIPILLTAEAIQIAAPDIAEAP
jgi:uncharacterized protein YbaR (Trm112 family)